MRKIIALIALMITFACPAGAAIVSGQCAIDKTVTSGSSTYSQCPFGDTNDYLIDHGYVAARLEADVRLSQTPIYVHDLCRYTDNRGLNTDAAQFIAFGTSGEWNSFISNPPAHVDVVECCLPRQMTVADVPPPNEQCFTNDIGSNTGAWILQSLVDPNDTTVVIAKPDGTDPTSKLVLQTGHSEDPNYPIQYLNVERDNIDAVLPKGSRASDYYVARWLCSFGKKPVGYSAPLANTAGAVPEATTAAARKTIGALTDVEFRLICRDANWTPIPPEFCEEGQVGSTYTEACSAGQAGLITKRIVHTCPDRTLQVQTVSNTCSDCAGKADELISTTTRACPSPQHGNIIVKTYRHYALNGTQCVTNDYTREDTSGCTTCPDDVPQADETADCPAGQTGQIVYSVVKHYTYNGTQCVASLIKTVKSNTCTTVCPPDQQQDDEVQACPSGQSGSIIYSVVKHYTMTNNQCVASLVKTLKSNTCQECNGKPDEVISVTHGQCPAGKVGQTTITVTRHYSLSGTQCQITDTTTTDTSGCTTCPADEPQGDETTACPAGQVGSVVYSVVKHYSISNNQCVPSLIKTLKTNSCTPCDTKPPEVISVTHGQCPAGKVGQTTITVTRTYHSVNNQCVATDTTTTDTSDCHSCPDDKQQADEVKSCPSGQSGTIVYSVVKHYTLSNNQCVASLVKTLKSNTCAECESKPDVLIRTTNEACPSGQSGWVVARTYRHYSVTNTQCVTSTYTTRDTSQCEACARTVDLGVTTSACPAGQTGVISTHKYRVYSVNSSQQCVSTVTSTTSSTCTTPSTGGGGGGGNTGGGGGDGGGW